MAPLALTLDTGCVIHGSQRERPELADLVDRLVDRAREDRVSLWLTTAYERDQERASEKHRRVNEEWLADASILGVAPGPTRVDYSTLGGPDVLGGGVPGPARWDYSTWDGPDVWADDDGAADEIVRRCVLKPHLWPENMNEHSVLTEKDIRKFHDVQHLMAHRMAGHDAFLTTDYHDRLRNRDLLTSEAGITVWTLAEAVASVEAAHA